MSKSRSASAISPEYLLLGLLNQRPAHGYELHERITRELGQIWHISLSQTYNILNRLETQGYISGLVQEQEKLPARRLFHLTAAGRRHFEIWLRVPSEASGRAVRVEFLTRLYFVYAADPEGVAGLIDSQIDEILASLSHLQAILAELPPEQVFNQLGLELRIRQLTSVLAWLDECRKRLA